MTPLVTHVVCIREVPGLNIDRLIESIYQAFLLFSPVLEAECWDVCSRYSMINSIRFLYNALFNPPTIRRGLDGPGIESRWGRDFQHLAHPASCTMGTSSFTGVESGRGVTLTLYPLLVPRYKTE
jgi:hypothetical protein